VSSGSVVPPGPTRRRLRVGPILWALIPALSLGLLAPVPFAHAAVRLKQRRLWAVTTAYAIGSLGWLVGVATPEGGWGDLLFGIVVIALVVVGTTHALVLRGRVFAPRAAPPATDPATAAALAAGKRREEARAIATGDVALAGELCVGHPELPRQFDEGGLVDVNHVPAQVLVDRLGLSPAQAGQVVEARERLGGFASPEQLIASSELSEAAVNALRERLLFRAVERAAATYDDWPEPSAPKDGKGAPPGWYPDPAGGPGGRYWDGAQWTDQMIVSSTPPASDPSRNLARVFTVEVVLALLALFLALILLLGADACYSARCYNLYGFAWLLLIVVSSALLVGCGAMFIVGSVTQRVAVKLLAVQVLSIGTVAAWIVYIVIAKIALDA
jgi:Protein of unknown function (DUF2510)/Helix-hairpin-helix motif